MWTTPGLTVPFSGKKAGEFDLFFGFVEGKWHFPDFFLPFAIFFFGSTAFHIPFLDSTSAPLTAGELLNRWVLRGLAGL